MQGEKGQGEWLGMHSWTQGKEAGSRWLQGGDMRRATTDSRMGDAAEEWSGHI